MNHVISVGRKAESIARTACLLLLPALLLQPWTIPAAQAEFNFDDIEFWVGTGANRAALVIDWVENNTDQPALAWGYRWDGDKSGRDMLLDIVAADARLFAKFNGTAASPIATLVYGLGYDADDDGQFGVQNATFDQFGRAYGNAPFFPAARTDPDDYYNEGWTFAFWHYGRESLVGASPFDGGSWMDSGSGMEGRGLADGSWDSWVFSPTFDFGAFAQNPVAAPSPFPLGDFNQDGAVDLADYDTWRSAFGSTTQPAADANRNGIVDAADYVIWRGRVAATVTSLPATSIIHVPEPATASLLAIAFACVQSTLLSKPRMNANERE